MYIYAMYIVNFLPLGMPNFAKTMSSKKNTPSGQVYGIFQLHSYYFRTIFVFNLHDSTIFILHSYSIYIIVLYLYYIHTTFIFNLHDSTMFILFHTTFIINLFYIHGIHYIFLLNHTISKLNSCYIHYIYILYFHIIFSYYINMHTIFILYKQYLQYTQTF